MKRLFRAAVGDPARLVALLAARLKLDTAEAARLVREGRVEVNGRRATEGHIAVGARVVAFLVDEAPTPDPLDVAWQDSEALVVDKPPGLRSQGVRGDSHDDLIGRVQRELNAEATLLHRLDRDTSGLVLFPTSNRARFRLQRDLDAGKIERLYLARVRGPITAQTITLRIGTDPDPRRRVALPENDPSGDPATTHVEPLEGGLVRLRLDTGRTHQLRVHLSAIGFPIVGDLMYGGEPAKRLMLHADELTFPDVTTGKPVTVRSQLEL